MYSQTNVFDFNPDELYYYPFTVSLGRCDGNCNTVEDPFGRICGLYKIEDKKKNVFNMITVVNE